MTTSTLQWSKRHSAWIVTFAAAAIMMVTMGMRQSIGLFISPLNSATGLGITTVSLAFAVAQLTWGAIQPVAGAVSDRYGPSRVLAAGLILLALGTALTPFITSAFGLIVTLGILSAIGSGAGSLSVLIGAAASHLPEVQRGKAAGVINAGGSFGQFVFAPIAQGLINVVGWMGAMWSLAILTLSALPLVRTVGRSGSVVARPKSTGASSVGDAIRHAFRDPSFLLLNVGFFTCGFHIAFLVTHLPGEVGLCGLPPAVASWSIALIGLGNVAGSLISGSSTAHFRSKHILAVMYGSRALLIGWYLLAPKTEWTFYVFAVGLGLTWLATAPPTATIVGKLFGPRYLATLFGMTILSHQVGGFLGAYLGGIALSESGNYQWMWYTDMALAVGAAIVSLPVREAPVPAPVLVSA
jgi:MFS family permease